MFYFVTQLNQENKQQNQENKQQGDTQEDPVVKDVQVTFWAVLKIQNGLVSGLLE